MNREREAEHVAERSLIGLVMANTALVNDEETALSQLQVLNQNVPDLRLFFWAAGSPNRFERFVRQPAKDLFILRINLQGNGGDSIQAVAFPVIQRIQQEPRRIINSR